MIKKARPGRTIWHVARRLIVSLLAGAVFLVVVGSVVAAAVSVSQRYRTPEDLVTHYQQHYEQQWYNSPEFAPQISDVEIKRRHAVDELNAVHIVFSWHWDWHGQRSKCSGDVLAQEYPDVFGGWRELGHIGFTCGEHRAGYPVKHAYWESLPLELPRTFNFYTFGSHGRATQVEAVLADGSSERVDVVDGDYLLLVQRNAPFRVKWLQFIGADGEAFTHRRVGYR